MLDTKQKNMINIPHDHVALSFMIIEFSTRPSLGCHDILNTLKIEDFQWFQIHKLHTHVLKPSLM